MATASLNEIVPDWSVSACAQVTFHVLSIAEIAFDSFLSAPKLSTRACGSDHESAARREVA
jgi:hypothetical protein